VVLANRLSGHPERLISGAGAVGLPLSPEIQPNSPLWSLDARLLRLSLPGVHHHVHLRAGRYLAAIPAS